MIALADVLPCPCGHLWSQHSVSRIYDPKGPPLQPGEIFVCCTADGYSCDSCDNNYVPMTPPSLVAVDLPEEQAAMIAGERIASRMLREIQDHRMGSEPEACPGCTHSVGEHLGFRRACHRSGCTCDGSPIADLAREWAAGEAKKDALGTCPRCSRGTGPSLDEAGVQCPRCGYPEPAHLEALGRLAWDAMGWPTSGEASLTGWMRVAEAVATRVRFDVARSIRAWFDSSPWADEYDLRDGLAALLLRGTVARWSGSSWEWQLSGSSERTRANDRALERCECGHTRGQHSEVEGWACYAAERCGCACFTRILVRPCTGAAADWCPEHGDCTCPGWDGAPIDKACPLHSDDSSHSEQTP